MGYHPIVYKEAHNLYGYQGDKRKESAHIIIERKEVGPASNDIGFERQEDGSFTMHISDYDKSKHKSIIQNVTRLYTQNVIKKEIEDNPKYTNILEQSIDQDGSMRIRVGVQSF